jgi:SRSO17 transposase
MNERCAVERTFGVRLPTEVQAAAAAVPEKPRRKGRPKLPRPAPLFTAGDLVAAQPEGAWQTVTWQEGTKGLLRKQFLEIRVHRATGDPIWGEYGRSTAHARVTTGIEGWLLAERPVPGKEGERKYYSANLPAATPPLRLVTIAHARWPIEQFYEEGKGEAGLDDYQGRRWDGFHRHLALVMLTYSFLMLQRHTAGPEGAFSPLARQSFPAAHRQVLEVAGAEGWC